MLLQRSRIEHASALWSEGRASIPNNSERRHLCHTNKWLGVLQCGGCQYKAIQIETYVAAVSGERSTAPFKHINVPPDYASTRASKPTSGHYVLLHELIQKSPCFLLIRAYAQPKTSIKMQFMCSTKCPYALHHRALLALRVRMRLTC